MIFFSRSTLICFFVFIAALNIEAQVFLERRATPGFEVSHKKVPRSNDVIIYAINETGKDLHVVVDFTTLDGYRSSNGIPMEKNIGVGRTELGRLVWDVLYGEHAFNYVYYNYPGVANPKIKNVEYAVPIKSGKNTEAVILGDIKEVFNQGTEDLYGIAFKGNIGDTICAARGGIVRKIVNDVVTDGDNLISSKTRNSIEIQHKDGTVGLYSIFKAGSAMITIGQEIEIGEPLALIDGTKYQLGPHFRFMLVYLSFEYFERAGDINWYKNKFLVPKFRTAKQGLTELENNVEYQSMLNEKLIVQEMSKRERKNYLKAKK